MEWGIIYDVVTKGGELVIDGDKRAELEKFILRLVRSNRKVVIFGNSGSGKSQLVNSLKDIAAIPQRITTTKKSKLNLEDFPIKLIDTPGHPESMEFRKREVENIIKYGIEGIINVVSYGYDETPNADTSNIFDAQGNVKDTFLTANRQIEIDRLREWLQWVRPGNVKWIINLVNKADIWWESFDVVNNYYQQSEYGKSMESLGKYISVVTIPHCSLIRPYFGVKTSGKFGDEHKDKLHNYFISILLDLLNSGINGK